MREFEQKALQVLTYLNFSIKGYYPYNSIIDIVGYFEPRKPLRNPTKVVAEIRGDKPNVEDIEGFFRFGKNALAEKMILFLAEEFNELTIEAKDLISKHNIEYFDTIALNKILEEIKPATSEVSRLTNACDILSSRKLAEALPDLANQIVPKDIGDYLPGYKAWEILEDAVFGVFQWCFGFETKQLGRQALFAHEPEGLVICPSKLGNNFGLIYECKSSISDYTISKKDELVYINYIREKKNPFKNLHNCELQYFLIISPSFSGDLKSRRDEIHQATGVLLCFIEATDFRDIALWAYGLSNNLKRLIDISQFLLLSDVVISKETITKYIGGFNKQLEKY